MFSRADKGPTPADFLARGFKKPSRKAFINGKARLLMEDAIRIAEKKLYKLKKSQLPSISDQQNAELLAEEVFHTPGSILKHNEIAEISDNAGCVNETIAERCRNLLNVNVFRTINGVCNNRRNPLQGASGTAFRRLIPAVYEDGNNALRGAAQGRRALGMNEFSPPHPSARLISTTIIQDIPQNEIPITHVLMQWGQFLDHDMDLGPEIEEECEDCTFTEICEPIRVDRNDPAFGVNTPNKGKCLTFRRAVGVCRFDTPGSFSPREQVNDLTSYIDGSMIYGSNREQEDAVRAFRNGLLRVGKIIAGTTQRLLPVIRPQDEFIACPGRDDCFLCGDIRCNEQVSLSVMHTIWLRQHNIIARGLRSLNPQWNDERIFQEARKIVGALIQKITYMDYLPKVLGQNNLDTLIGQYEGYDPSVDASIPNSFATAAYRYGHSLIRPRFNRLGPGYTNQEALNLRDMFFNPDLIKVSGGTDPIVRGWVTQNARRMDEFLNIVLTSQLFETTALGGMDLASLNIQRQRDHGMPGYRTFRDFCRREFPELPLAVFENELTEGRFLKLHGDLDNIDLWIGGIAERRIPGSLLGPTFACLFGLTFGNVRDGDRFYFERRGVFTSKQLKSIKRTTLSRVLCDTSDDIRTIQSDAFRSNIGRVSCNSFTNIPRLSLAPWRETVSYFRIRSSISGLPVILAAFKSNKDGSPATFVNDAEETCIPFTTPSSDYNVATYVYPHVIDHNSCTVKSQLPSELINGESSSFYHSGITTSHLTTSNGIYSSLESCKSGTVDALTWTCNSNVQLASTTSTEDIVDGDIKPSSNLDSPDSLTTAPAGLIRKMDEYYGDEDVKSTSVKELEKELANSNQKKVSKEISNKQLLDELEAAMDKLN